MQLVRVATKDPQNASLLVVHLAALVGGEQVSLQSNGEVQVRLPELNGELVKTLKAVESWLGQCGIASAEVSVNEHSFTVEHPERVEIGRASSRSDGVGGPRCGRRLGGLARGGWAAMSSDAVTAGIERETPRLVFFHDKRSGKSRRAEGFLAQVLQSRGNHQSFVIHRVEVAERPDLAQRFKVASIPTLLVVEDKKVQARLESPTGCKDIELLLRPWLRSHSEYRSTCST
jgi:hypothetical protein